MQQFSSKILLIFCSFLFVTTSQGAEMDVLRVPVAFVPQNVFKFPNVSEGAKIAHDFIIQNKGNEVLKIEKVETT